MPQTYDLFIFLIELVIIALVIYAFLLLTMLCMLNYVLIGVFAFSTIKIFKILEKMRKKIGFKYKTKDFDKFMKKENLTVYQKMDFPIKLTWEKEGRWLEFIIEDAERTYEQMIADRRELMFKQGDEFAISEFAQIMNEYSSQKAKDDRARALN